MVLDGRAAALWGGGAGWPGFMTMASSREGARFIAPDAADIQRILGKHPFLKQVTQPAGAFPGQTAAIPSVGSWSFVLARPGPISTRPSSIVSQGAACNGGPAGASACRHNGEEYPGRGAT